MGERGRGAGSKVSISHGVMLPFTKAKLEGEREGERGGGVGFEGLNISWCDAPIYDLWLHHTQKCIMPKKMHNSTPYMEI